MRWPVSSNAAVGTFLSVSRRSGSEVIASPSFRSASLGQCPAGRERNILPKRPSKRDDRGAELSPRTPPPGPPDRRFLAEITAFILSYSTSSEIGSGLSLLSVPVIHTGLF